LVSIGILNMTKMLWWHFAHICITPTHKPKAHVLKHRIASVWNIMLHGNVSRVLVACFTCCIDMFHVWCSWLCMNERCTCSCYAMQVQLCELTPRVLQPSQTSHIICESMTLTVAYIALFWWHARQAFSIGGPFLWQAHLSPS
jgi:hypothetical protein